MKKIKKYNETTQKWETLCIAEGKQGIQGIQGERGIQGVQGIQGERGAQGERGEKGDSYILTNTDKQEIATLVEGEFIQCSEITRIEAVSEYPATEEPGVLYILI